MDREPLQARALELAAVKRAEAESKLGLAAGLVTSAVKGAVVLLFKHMGVRPPQNEDTLNFAMSYIIQLVMDGLESAPIDLQAEEVPEKVDK